jgi:hypothetical protein
MREATVLAAQDLVHRVLADRPERIRHSAAVAARATSMTDAVADDEKALLVAAAWVHDIGYAPALKDTGFHPLDGARFLRLNGWEPALCDLVAHHSGSRFVASVTGMDEELSEFTFVENPLSDALTIADQTIGPEGPPLSLDERMHDMLERHGPDSPNSRAHPERESYFRAALQRVTQRLAVDLDFTAPLPRDASTAP